MIMNTVNETKRAKPTPLALSRRSKLREWEAEARGWVGSQGCKLIKLAGKPMTVADTMCALDLLVAPPGYELMRHDYQKRYHFVRRALLAQVKCLELEQVGAVNARKRACVAFCAPQKPLQPRRRRFSRGSNPEEDYAILVEGSPEWKGKLEDLIKKNPEIPFEAVLITKRG